MVMSRMFSGRHLVAFLMILPALAGACAITAGEGLALRSAWCCAPVPAVSLADALRNSDLDAAFLHIRAKQDPNAPIEFRDASLTGDRRIRTAPLMIAIASNKEDSVMMLLGAGAKLDPRGNALAKCLSTRLGHEKMAQLLERYGGPSDPQVACPDAKAMLSAPLVWLASAAL
jgi:hypothetical protein